ncbi:MAG TPA: hypothetical protein VKV32_05645 [Stellaceae bacterium]|nr:hypothetical protein [Stellaceae bacterium]
MTWTTVAPLAVAALAIALPAVVLSGLMLLLCATLLVARCAFAALQARASVAARPMAGETAVMRRTLPASFSGCRSGLAAGRIG